MFAEMRDLNFRAVGQFLSKEAKKITAAYEVYMCSTHEVYMCSTHTYEVYMCSTHEVYMCSTHTYEVRVCSTHATIQQTIG